MQQQDLAARSQHDESYQEKLEHVIPKLVIDNAKGNMTGAPCKYPANCSSCAQSTISHVVYCVAVSNALRTVSLTVSNQSVRVLMTTHSTGFP